MRFRAKMLKGRSGTKFAPSSQHTDGYSTVKTRFAGPVIPEAPRSRARGDPRQALQPADRSVVVALTAARSCVADGVADVRGGPEASRMCRAPRERHQC